MSHKTSSNWGWLNDGQINDERLLGQTKEFDAADVFKHLTTQPVAVVKNFTRGITMRLVKNKLAGTLAPGAALIDGTDAVYGPRVAVSNIAGADSEKVVGFVPSWFTAAVAADAIFPMVVHGPCQGLYSGSGSLAVGGHLKSNASAQLVAYVKNTDVSEELVATVLEAISSGAAGTKFWIHSHPFNV